MRLFLEVVKKRKSNQRYKVRTGLQCTMDDNCLMYVHMRDSPLRPKLRTSPLGKVTIHEKRMDM